MRRLVAAEKGETDPYVPDEQPPFFHDIDYIVRTWLEHKIHHTYPEPGGYNEQCEWLMRDWHVVNMYNVRVEHGEFSAPPIPQNAPNWQSMVTD